MTLPYAINIIAAAHSTLPLRVFFSVLLVLVVAVAVYVVKNRKKLFARSGDPSTDSPASGNLRMAMVVLVLIHAIVLLIITIIDLS